MTDRIVYLNSELFYYKEGDGGKVILLFHGFGQDHRAFESWIEELKKEYTIYAFDLFFHGNSGWENQRAMEKRDWKKILQLFIDREKIENFEIAGFSIGAKFVFATLELFPDRIKKIRLIAPDGIQTNFWYGLAIGTSAMRSLFRSMVLKPKRLLILIKVLRFLHIENKELLRFVEFQMSTEEKRKRVYKTWIYFRHLNFELKELSSLLNFKNTPVIFILGKSDKVIPTKKIKAFAKTLNNHQIQIVDAGHNDLIRRALV